MKDASDLKPRGAKMNLTPMIDVVFLLIIFFVVSNTMMQNDVSMQLDLPSAVSGEADADETESGKIILNVDTSGSVFFGAKPVTRDELKAALLKEKSDARRPLEIRIRTDRSVPYERIEPVLILCAESGIGNVSFSVMEE